MSRQLILIVDDRPTNQSIFAKLAGSLGEATDVNTCGDPRDALAWLEDHSPDLIIVDYRMPYMNGAAFTAEVRQRPHLADVPIIVITAYDDRGFRLKALDAGATDFLQSPIDHREFQSRARNLLIRRRQQLSMLDRAHRLEQLLEQTRNAITLPSEQDFALLRQVIDGIPMMISATDRDGKCLFANAKLAAICNTTPADLAGCEVADLFGDQRGEEERLHNETVLRTGRPLPSYEDAIEHDGVRSVYLTTKVPLRGPGGDVIGLLTASVDITGRKITEDHLNHIARHDLLTGLPNRILLRDRLQLAVDAANRDGGLVAVSVLDLDGFKLINDTRGHQVGDRLLKEVAARVRSSLSGVDFAARLGGDEFAIIQSISSIAEAADRTETLLATLNSSYPIDGGEVGVTASIGVSVSPIDSDTPDDLLRTADLAMYHAKKAGRNGYCFFTADMNRRAQEEAELQADLHVAIAEQQFLLHYQPLVSARLGTINGVEALVRWQHPRKGLLAPHQFFEAAHETGLIVPIGRWVLHEACRQLAAWRRAGAHLARISVNLSALQFQRQNVYDLVCSALEETGLPPSSLELEITETTLLRDSMAVAETLRRLRHKGVLIAIDDFGTGYASLEYLRDLPADGLKIDRTFVAGAESSETDAAIIRAISHLGRELHMNVVAEGVETPTQYALLTAAGCDELQGYYIGRPCAAADMQRLLSSGRAPLQARLRNAVA